ncbi:MAG: sulfatase/phosphatase domain-containing protein, partial [Verrucomicrobiota bacterium]
HPRAVPHWATGAPRDPVPPRGPPKPGIKADGEKTLSDWVRQVNQAVISLDEGVGRLVESLQESGQLENTLILFTSDQGFAWGQHGFQVKKAPYDANIRSPFIISMPSRFAQGEVCPHPVGGVDVVPTFFSVAGIDLPWEMHGRDLTPMLENPGAPDLARPVLTAFTGDSYGSASDVVPSGDDTASRTKLFMRGNVPWWISLIDGREKYIRTLVAGEPEELYDLGNDPEELNNLARDPAYRDRVLELREATVAELRRTDAGLVETLPEVAPLP